MEKNESLFLRERGCKFSCSDISWAGPLCQAPLGSAHTRASVQGNGVQVWVCERAPGPGSGQRGTPGGLFPLLALEDLSLSSCLFRKGGPVL